MRVLILALFVIIFSFNLYSQEIQAEVNVIVEQVQQENRFYASTMESDLERYINNQKFSSGEWEGPPIPVKINIHLSGGFNGAFSARMFIAAQRYIYGQGEAASVTIRMIENNWRFSYQQGGMISFNPNRFDRFASIIDYYMYLIIGFDLDSYEELGGTALYDKAKYVVQLGAAQNIDGFSTFYQTGEMSKYSLLAEMTDLRYEALRILIFEYYVDGLDYMIEDEEAALKNLELIIKDMAIFKQKKMVGPSALVQLWFNTKVDEICATFKGRMSDQLYKDLTYLDPTNTTQYQQAYEATR